MNKLDIVSKKIKITVNDDVSKKLSEDWHNLEKQIDKLKAINTSGVKPMVRIFDDVDSYLREDEPGEAFKKEVVLENAPKTDGDFIILPKVVKND